MGKYLKGTTLDLLKLNNQWFALQVKCGREAMCAQILRNKGYEGFLPLGIVGVSGHPLRASTRRWPLFPGYLFCRLSADVYGPIVTTPGVLRVLGFGGIPSPVSEAEIENLQRLVDSGHPTSRWPYFAVGQLVRITRGALCGLTGKLVRVKNAYRLIVSIDLLLRSVATEVDAESVATANFVDAYGSN